MQNVDKQIGGEFFIAKYKPQTKQGTISQKPDASQDAITNAVTSALHLKVTMQTCQDNFSFIHVFLRRHLLLTCLKYFISIFFVVFWRVCRRKELSFQGVLRVKKKTAINFFLISPVEKGNNLSSLVYLTLPFS